MTAAGYLRLEGQCFGNILKVLTTSEAECGKACNAHEECKGYGYIFSNERRFPTNACILRKKLCRTPMRLNSMNISTYFPINNEGKLLYVILRVVLKPDRR